MRLLCTFEHEGQGREFSQFLTASGIANECEVLSVNDWGSDTYGNHYCRIWVIDEDQTALAETLHDQYLADPNAPKFKQNINIVPPLAASSEQSGQSDQPKPPLNALQTKPLGAITFYLLLLCTAVFMWEGVYESLPKGLPANLRPIAYLTGSAVSRAFLFDYPKTYEIVDRIEGLLSHEPTEEETSPKAQSPEVEQLIEQFNKTPMWTGLYDKLVLYMKGQSEKIRLDAPMFEKIREGEIWRFVTPILLHGNILHLLFNLLWILVLGKQVELRLGAFRYILFIVLTAAISNTAQYVMGGPNFLGISGVAMAMVGFIYVRQQRAPWEGYLLQRSTLGFLVFFVLAVFGVQVVSFFTEVFYNQPLASGIANTAHIVGAISGYALGRLDYFAWKRH